MKILKIILLSIVVLLFAGILGLFIFLKTVDVNRYLPQITQAASKALGCPLTIERADLDLSWTGIALNVRGISIFNGPAPIVHIEKARGVLDIVPLLRQNRVHGRIEAASGAVTIDAGTLEDFRAQRLNVHAVLSGLKVEEIFVFEQMPVKVKGKAGGDITLSGTGFEPKALMKSLKGQGQMALSDAVIEHLDILKTMLGSTLGAMLGAGITDELGGDSTALEKAEAKFSIADEVVSIDELLASAKTFDLNAKGTVGFDMKTDIAVAMLVSQDLSAQLGKKVKVIQQLYDENKRIKVSGQVTGAIPNVKFSPSQETRDAASNAIIEQGNKALEKVIEKNPALGQILNSDDTKQLLNNVLNKIFK